jgi:hypothetical protein
LPASIAPDALVKLAQPEFEAHILGKPRNRREQIRVGLVFQALSRGRIQRESDVINLADQGIINERHPLVARLAASLRASLDQVILSAKHTRVRSGFLDSWTGYPNDVDIFSLVSLFYQVDINCPAVARFYNDRDRFIRF